MKLYLINISESQTASPDFVQEERQVIGSEPLYNKLIDAIFIVKCLAKIHEIKFVAHGMEKFPQAHGILPKEGIKHIRVSSLNHPPCSKPVFFQLHEQDDLLGLAVHGKGGV